MTDLHEIRRRVSEVKNGRFYPSGALPQAYVDDVNFLLGELDRKIASSFPIKTKERHQDPPELPKKKLDKDATSWMRRG